MNRAAMTPHNRVRRIEALSRRLVDLACIVSEAQGHVCAGELVQSPAQKRRVTIAIRNSFTTLFTLRETLSRPTVQSKTNRKETP